MSNFQYCVLITEIKFCSHRSVNQFSKRISNRKKETTLGSSHTKNTSENARVCKITKRE